LLALTWPNGLFNFVWAYAKYWEKPLAIQLLGKIGQKETKEVERGIATLLHQCQGHVVIVVVGGGTRKRGTQFALTWSNQKRRHKKVEF